MEIADELEVDGLLTGTVARTADRVRIALQLYDAREDRNVWAEHYERPLRNIFELQTDVARAVADELGIELSKHEINSLSKPHVDPSSYEAYLLGRNFALRGMYSQAVPMLQRAIDLDGANADAYAALGAIKVDEAWRGASPRKVYAEVRHFRTPPIPELVEASGFGSGSAEDHSGTAVSVNAGPDFVGRT